jgi:NAD-dependent DNA ligase
MSEALHHMFNRARLDDRLVNELIGLARGITADGMVNLAEAEYLQKWLVANIEVRANPVIANLLERINRMLSDNILDADEARELLDTLHRFSGGNFELGELLKSSSLPFDAPAPDIIFDNRRFCFTGTFAFGSRTECEAKALELGGIAGPLTMKTDYLVIGIYATDSWAHSAYGRKIEHAVEMQSNGVPIKIVGEQYWRESFPVV